MKRIYLTILISCFFSALFWSCNNEPICHDGINFYNNSNKAVYIFQYITESAEDTLLPQIFSDVITANKEDYIINSYSVRNLNNYSVSCYEYSLRPYNNYFLKFFVIDTITFSSIPFETIRSENLATRYDITLEMIQQKDWMLEFPN